MKIYHIISLEIYSRLRSIVTPDSISQYYNCINNFPVFYVMYPDKSCRYIRIHTTPDYCSVACTDKTLTFYYDDPHFFDDIIINVRESINK